MQNYKKAFSFLIILFLSFSWTQAQTLKITEVMSANTQTLLSERAEHSDWIELTNTSDEAVKLEGYGLSDKKDDPLKWVFPDVTLAPKERIIVFASGRDRTSISHYETVIDEGDSWYYFTGTPPTNWNQDEFDALQWLEGPSGFGYGDGDDRILLPNVESVYIRNSFQIDSLKDVKSGLLALDFDDAYIAFLNGQEIERVNIALNADMPFAVKPHEAGLYRGKNNQDLIYIKKDQLREGINTIAIAVYTYSTNNQEAEPWVEEADLSIVPMFALRYDFDAIPTPSRGPSASLWPLLPKLHTNFTLKQGGETLILSDPNGGVIQEIALVTARADVAQGYGSYTKSWGLLSQPSPGWENAEVYNRVATMPSASVEAGVYDNAVSVALQTSEADARIFYTLDGSEPTQSSWIYLEPISLHQTAVLRARAFLEDAMPSEVLTHTYLITETTSLPIVSLAIAPENLWGDEGIYTTGPHIEADKKLANYFEEWTRPASMEFFEPNGYRGFQKDVGIELFGASARRTPRKSFEIKTTGAFSSGEINYEIFPGYEVTSFENLILRSSSNDWDRTLFRDALMQRLLATSGLATQAYRPVLFFLNGQYWGIYNLREKMDEKYLKAHYETDLSKLDLLEGYVDDKGKFKGSIKAGSAEDYLALIEFVKQNDLSDVTTFDYVASQIDVPNYLAYTTAQIYFANFDWPGNNIRFWREEGGKWRWLIFDLDYSMGLYQASHYDANSLVNVLSDAPVRFQTNWPGASILLQSLLSNEGFKQAFIKQFEVYINTLFQPEVILEEIDRFESVLSPEIPRHIARWSSMSNLDNVQEWQSQIENLREFALNRPDYMKQHLLERFGEVEVEKSLMAYLSIEENLLYAQALPQAIVINEINYHSADNLNSEDWIELYNVSENTIDLSGWQLRDSQDDIPFIFPEGTLLPAGGYLVSCKDSQLFADVYMNINAVTCLGNWDFGLKGSGEKVRLLDNTGTIVDAVEYSDTDPWSMGADGGGVSLELVDAQSDNSLAQNWLTSQWRGGTPGQKNTVSSTID